MVLYRILGVTLYDEDSRGSPMVAAVILADQNFRMAIRATKDLW